MPVDEVQVAAWHIWIEPVAEPFVTLKEIRFSDCAARMVEVPEEQDLLVFVADEYRTTICPRFSEGLGQLTMTTATMPARTTMMGIRYFFMIDILWWPGALYPVPRRDKESEPRGLLGTG